MMEEKFKELIEEIWRGKQCEGCREARKAFSEKEKKWHGKYSPIYPGFWHNINQPPNLPIDVLIVTQSHGGGDWPEKNNKESVIKDSYDYHKIKKIVKFFQHNIRKIVDSLDASNTTWFVTDLVKCFIVNNK